MGFQCCNGGLTVNRDMATTVEGLYAAGENAGGLHGADRLGGNMLAGCLISGRLAGEQAAAYAQTRAPVEAIAYQPKASLARQESRGGFYREDYPNSSQGRPEAQCLTLSETGKVTLRKTVLDPEWQSDFKDSLDKARWG